MKNNSDNNFVFVGTPLEVKVTGNFDQAMRLFRALVQKEKVLSTYKEKSRYEKPSDKKRRKRNEMKRKLMELEMKFDVDYQVASKKRTRENPNQHSQE